MSFLVILFSCDNQNRQRVLSKGSSDNRTLNIDVFVVIFIARIAFQMLHAVFTDFTISPDVRQHIFYN